MSKLHKNRPILVVRNVLLSLSNEQNPSLLLGLRAKTCQWELPGGKVDNETVRMAGLREQTEETGMYLQGDCKHVGFADVVSMRGVPGRRFVDLFLQWTMWRGEATVKEPDTHLAWRWFSVKTLPTLDKMASSTRYFVEHLLPGLLSGSEAQWQGEDIEPDAKIFREMRRGLSDRGEGLV